jgi:hypothetical protein
MIFTHLEILKICLVYWFSDSVKNLPDSLRTWLPVLLVYTFLLEGTFVDGNDDHSRKQELSQQSTNPDSFGIVAYVIILYFRRIGDSIS